MEITNLKFKSFYFLLTLLPFYLCFFTSVPSALAETMENDMYHIQMGNLDSITGESSGSKYNLSITSGQTAPGEYSGTNYKVKSGFQYVPKSSPFTFSISNTMIDFGTLTPTNPVARTTILTVNNTSAQSYKVTSAENHELETPTTGAKIPDTTCDDGQCTESKATKWDSTLTYGFGYRCDNENGTCVAEDDSFTNKKYFKHFSNSSNKETSSTIMSGGIGIAQKATITYKVNISSSQASGLYTNAVTYLATPSY